MLEAFAASAPGIPLTVIEPEPSDTVMRARSMPQAHTPAQVSGADGTRLRSMDQFVSTRTAAPSSRGSPHDG